MFLTGLILEMKGKMRVQTLRMLKIQSQFQRLIHHSAQGLKDNLMLL